MSSKRPDLKFVDNGEERLYYRKYESLSEKEPSVIRIIDHNNKDYFTVLDEDADLIADNIYKTQSIIKYSQSKKHRYVTISPQVLLNNVLKFCLVDNSYKVEIYQNKTFDMIVSATPGNLESLSSEYGVNLEGMFSDCSSPVIAAVKYIQQSGQKKVGVCMIDLLNNLMQLCEFEDNELFSNLESLILQTGIKEIVLPSNYEPLETGSDNIKLFQVLNKIGNLVLSTAKSSLFTSKDIEQDLSKFIATSNELNNVEAVLASKGINSVEFSTSLSCCNALLNYLDLFSLDSASFTVEKYTLSAYMKLDLSAMKALNIFSSQLNNFGNAYTKGNSVNSIFDLLNKCKTAAGSRLLSQWLKQPLTNANDIQERHRLVELIIDNTDIRVFLIQDWLRQVPDVKRLLKKITNGVNKSSGNENKKLEDVVRLYQLVLVLPNLIEKVKETMDSNIDEDTRQNVEKHWFKPISERYEALLKFQELVETTIDLSPLDSSNTSDLLNADFNIKLEFDDSLTETNSNIQDISQKIKDCQYEVSEDLGMEVEKKLKLEKHQQHGWCFRVTRNDSSVLRNTGNKYIELQTVKAGVYFTTKDLRSLAQKYQVLSDDYNSKQRELIREILSITLTYHLVFINLALSLAHLDVITSFANVAIFAPIPYAKPVIHPLSSDVDSDEYRERRLKLKEARHPVLEAQDDISFISNDVNLANNSSEAENGKAFVIITGPNMGGKSTYIRQIGVIALMNQIGSFVPASDADFTPEVPVFDAILSRVGAGDSQMKGLSTFMIEMLETSSILATASHNSLIIIDELGRGTSTYDGFGLAWSILEHLITEKRCFTLFATHFHELTDLSAKYNDRVENLHVAAHVENEDKEGNNDITLMYKVEPGISDKSFGIHVAELVKFPEKIVNVAKRKASELQSTNSKDIDPYVQSKKTKCSDDEVQIGLENLRKILKEWKSLCYNETSGEISLEPDAAMTKLRELIAGKYSSTIKSDNFLNEIITKL